jgi:Ca2+-binding EF-hand superfamily protein
MKRALAIFAVLAGLAALTTVLTTAQAQGSPKPQLTFEQLDTNKDGRISVSEARRDKVVAARFAAADANQDGYLDRKEFDSIGR